ncbi:heme NO-binding domain-containing protein [Litoribrevibacter albus]|uniref:Guanylate cyclase n=1 Tax=Litoribrevibacter albus TaxID=1473156 RepID=A0AA37S6Z6_9GAMM|nr:heme NO-binding domain-containing protein [Litoribrevibacter albus]GLQ30231.1 guanylate cyclase [Litoribrevibacter albus]
MKGIVFTEFFNMVEEQYDLDMVDQLIELTNTASGGAYTSVGTYDYQELVELITKLSEISQCPVNEWLHKFGQYLARTFSEKFSDFYTNCDSALSLLKEVEEHIHVEVRKLYPDSELPTFKHESSQNGESIFIYQSSRNLADLAQGLIVGSAEFYNQILEITREDSVDQGLYQSIFKITVSSK